MVIVLKEIGQRGEIKNKKIVFYILGCIISLCLVCVFVAQPGKMIKESIQKTFIMGSETKTIRVYNSGELISTYVGKYTIEQYDDYNIIVNHDTDERIDFYGNTALVISTK